MAHIGGHDTHLVNGKSALRIKSGSGIVRKMDTEKKNSQIYQLLAVIFSAVAVALILAGGLIYHFSPQSSYLAKNVLLSPEVVRQIAFQEKAKLNLNDIEFVYYDSDATGLKKIDVDQGKYAKFYALVSSDRSFKAHDDLLSSFREKKPASLFINVKSKNAPASSFQEVLFIPDYYRVDLHQEGNETYAYFYHPQIYDQVVRLFTHE